jgi:diacylglycerol kinase family enzyme
VAGFLIVNPRSGDEGPTAEELVAEARRRGIEPYVLEAGDDAAAAARAARADALGMAGGDGSLGTVAQVAIERGLPFVCVPYGTRNHFARDLGLDRDDPVGALDAFAHRRERIVDVGRIGAGRVFLNNVSVGVYARLVHRREHHRRRRDTLARARAIALGLGERHPEPILVDGTPVAARVLLVANNAYELDVFNIGERARLDEGKLHAYIAEDWLPRTWHERVAESFHLGGADGNLRAAVDGEPVELDSPIELRIAPRALHVLLPRQRES